MAIDIKEKVSEIVKKAQSDPKFMQNLKDDPVKAVESIIGIDLPDDITNQIVKEVKEKISGKASDDKKEDSGSPVDNVVGAIKKLF